MNYDEQRLQGIKLFPELKDFILNTNNCYRDIAQPLINRNLSVRGFFPLIPYLGNTDIMKPLVMGTSFKDTWFKFVEPNLLPKAGNPDKPKTTKKD